MGLFGRLTGKQPKKSAEITDDQLLFHAMLCMAAADGEIDEAELAMVEAFFLSLPEFRNRDFDKLLDGTKGLFDEHGGVAESVKALSGLESPAIRKKAFVLAVDVALASGDVADSEDQMLDVIQHILEIDDAFVGKVIEVLSSKYEQ